MATGGKRKKSGSVKRREKILKAASELIVRNGYRGTSLDAVVERAGCSKSAIYEYFGSKEGLLAALTEEVVHELSLALFRYSHSGLSVEGALVGYARKAMELVLDERHVSVIRVIVSEVWRFPKLGYSYYQLGPKAVQRQFADFLEIMSQSGKLDVEDPMEASRVFWAILLWDALHGRLVGAVEPLDDGQIEVMARRAVDQFMLMFGNRAASGQVSGK
jgi:AcrR family transcriptional regulator